MAWTGRLSLQVESDPPQSFSAGYEMTGQAERGELRLFTPLGGTVAVLNWSPGTATLQSDGRTQEFASIDALAERATGTEIPIAALFSWLHGQGHEVPGWHADLSQVGSGRLNARRLTPPPEATLRMVIDR